jgi:Wadjet protein JetD, C-terminal
MVTGISFIPSPDVAVIVNSLLDKFENRAKLNTDSVTRNPKTVLADISLPAYFSQTDPNPRLIANEQLVQLEQAGLINLAWLPGETGHLLQSITLKNHEPIYTLIHREPVSIARSRLETTLLADQFRFSRDDWQTRAIYRTLKQLHAGKSTTPFSLTDSSWNLDLLTALSALSTLKTETPYRVFSVHTFNDSKRFDELKPAIVRLARQANREWKTLSSEDVLRELNLVANPTYVHLAGNWQFTTQGGEILSLGGFIPSVGFPAAQIDTIQSVIIHADSVLCIENLTSFHEFLRIQETHKTEHAIICLMGNPSPSIRRLLRLIPEKIPIHIWSDIDYGGFNILSQLRRSVSVRIQPYLMDISTFEKYAHLSRPLTQTDIRNLKRLCARPELANIRSIIEHLIHRGLKLEQEAIQI